MSRVTEAQRVSYEQVGTVHIPGTVHGIGTEPDASATAAATNP